MRYKVVLSYMGTNYSGWQKQPGAKTVQGTIEEVLSTVLREAVELVGCGRTDTGVHAREYVAHFDSNNLTDPTKTTYQVNAILPSDIAVAAISFEAENFHARFDATERSYVYSIHFQKDPFLHNHSYYLNASQELNQEAMKIAAEMMKDHEHFYPLSKTGSDNKNYQCVIKKSEWYFGENKCYYAVSANRFLRGMVRIIVGACLNVGYGKLSLADLEMSLIKQTLLPIQWSVPPQGLCFTGATYPATPSPQHQF